MLSDSDDSTEIDTSGDDLCEVNTSGNDDVDSEDEREHNTDDRPSITVPNNNNNVWTDPHLVNRRQLIFLGTTGLKRQPTANSPGDYFNMLIDQRFYDIIIETESNVLAPN